MLTLILLCMIFVVTLIVIWSFPPDTMVNEQDYKASVKDLWGVVKICQTSNFGKPSLTLRPSKRSVEMFLHFLDADRVSLSLPLLLKKQKAGKQDYMELFSDHGLTAFEAKNQLTAYLDRNDEKLGHLVALLYRKVFEASNTDTVNFQVKAVSSDLRPLQLFKRPKYKLNPDYKFKAPSARHKGKSAHQVQMSRILNAFSWLLFAPIIILSYKYSSLMTMCWAALIFFTFFLVYRTYYQKKRITENWGGIVHCGLLSATLITQDTNFLQFIPSTIGVFTAVLSGALVLGVLKPQSENEVMQKQNNPREYRFMKSFWVFGGLGLFAINEWARRSFDIESWIWFYGFMRIELVIVMTAVFAPAYALFFLRKKNNVEN